MIFPKFHSKILFGVKTRDPLFDGCGPPLSIRLEELVIYQIENTFYVNLTDFSFGILSTISQTEFLIRYHTVYI